VRFAGLAALCATALVAPALLLVWMPLFLGVPHVASDIRYLVLPLPRAQIALAIAASLALVALRAVAVTTGINLLLAEAAIVAGWLLAALVLEPAARKRALGIALFASAMIIGMPIVFIAIAALAHNFLAVVAWVVVTKPTKKQALTLVGGVALFAVIAGLVGPVTSAITGGDASPWLTVDKAAGVMFGGLPHSVARGLLIAFAFLQGVHYAIWLGWIPTSQGRPRSGLATIAVGAATLTVLAGALYNPAWARSTYLALATFHIYLEIVILAARWSRGPTKEASL
jgi:hypothetical protein